MSDHRTTTSGADMHELGPTGAVGGEHMVLNFGPQHPATHGTFRLLLELDGERIVRCTPYIGYLHSGFEKLGEHHTYNQYVTVVDRMNYMSPFANDLAYHMAVERGCDVDKPRNLAKSVTVE